MEDPIYYSCLNESINKIELARLEEAFVYIKSKMHGDVDSIMEQMCGKFRNR
jgi:hypothetical protein